jgi:uncharacterized membrane protein
MLDRLNRSTSTRGLAWGLVGLLLPHVLEEAGSLLPWLRRNRDAIDRLPLALQHLALRLRPGHVAAFYGLVVLWMTAAAAPVARRGRRARRTAGAFAFGVAAATLLLGSIGHVVLSLAARRYTPGVTTAALTGVPYGAYVLWRLTRDGVLSRSQLAGALLLALLPDPPVHLTALLLGRAARGGG